VNALSPVIALWAILPTAVYGQTPTLPSFRTFVNALFDEKPSVPEPFGYKIGWIAVRSTDPNAVAAALPVRSRIAASWHTGIDTAYKGGGAVFVSPPIGGWVCIIGEWAMGTGERGSFQGVAKAVADLSARFGEAQGYATHRIIEYHHWIMASMAK